MIEPILKEIGLSDYEAKIYTALLELGESTTGEILKKAHLTSGKIYEILDSLQNKGLVSMIIKSGVKRFSPADPRRVLDYLEEKKGDIEEQKIDFQKILPELNKKIQKVKSPLNIEIFTGIKGLKTAYKKELNYHKKGSDLYIMGVISSEEYLKEVVDFFVFYMKSKRVDSKIKIKKILGESARSFREQHHEKEAIIKYIPYGNPVSIEVIGSLTVLGIDSERIYITIENKDVADSFIEQFNLLWKIAKK
tara:strand:- start:14879 stop:15628 length:750 start_codon:yes stop_codon:yes gene_type:complete